MATSRRWRLLIGLALVLLIGIGLSFPAVHWKLIGWVRGEAFYEGRPTSYWVNRIDKYLSSLRPIPGKGPSLWDRLVGYQPVEDGDRLALLLSQPEALPVALDMLRNDRFEIRRSAISVLYGMNPLPLDAAEPLRDYLRTRPEDNEGLREMASDLLQRIEGAGGPIE